jgi:glycosyltransferase involved in cell wall biosynthesis
MEIVHVMNWYIPSMGYQENFLPAEQKKLGHEVYIITSDRVPHYTGYESNVGRLIGKRIIGTGTFNEHGVTIYRLPAIYEVKNGGQVYLKGLYKTLAKLKPDVVQAHGAFELITLQVILYSKRLHYRIFVDDHSNIDNFHLNTLPKKIYIQFVKLFYHFYINRIFMFFPVSYASWDLLKRVLGISEHQLELLPLGANTVRFHKSIELRNQGRSELDLKENEKLILTAGKLHEQKDIEYLIKAVSYVNDTVPSIKLLIIGNGTQQYMDELKGLVNNLELSKKVIFMDFAPNNDLPKYYNAGDIGVWPGNCSITVLEAVATSLPVVIPDDDLNYKILFDNQAAVGFERRNINSLAHAILELLNNSGLRNDVMDNSSKLFLETLSWKEIALKSTNIYKK